MLRKWGDSDRKPAIVWGVAKVGQWYWWAVWAEGDFFNVCDPLCCGKDRGRAVALDQALEAAIDWIVATGSYLRPLTHAGYVSGWRQREAKKARAARPPSKERDAAPVEYLYSRWESEYPPYERGWTKHQIVKKTAKRVFVQKPYRYAVCDGETINLTEETWVLDRQQLEDKGSLRPRSSWTRLYTEEARQELEVELQTRSIPSFLQALGLTCDCTIDHIKAVYRKRSLVLHPDRGGDGAAFIELQRHYESATQWAEKRQACCAAGV
jgi:hypothetical protein